MKIQKTFIFAGMIGSILFFLQDILGMLLWKSYNPITMYISLLTADGSPNLKMTRFFFYANNVCLILFVLGMCYIEFHCSHRLIKIGYGALLLGISISFFCFGVFPMTMDNIFTAQNIIHFSITIAMLVMSALSIYFLAIGYLSQKKQVRIGYLSLAAAILFTVFNLLHLYVILTGLNILGLVQRLSIYTFYIYVFILSFLFVQNLEK